MKRTTAAAIAVVLGIGFAPTAWAQTATPGTTATGSISEAQARMMLEAAGLRNIRDLTSLSDGSWRAQVTNAAGGNVVARIDSQGTIVLNTGVAGTTAPLPQASTTPLAEDQARMMLEAAGLRNIRDLTSLSDGSWRAQVTNAAGGNVVARIDSQGTIVLNTGVAGTTAPMPQASTTPLAEDQVRSMMEAAGLRNIRDLTQMSDGSWRAQVTSGSGGNVQARIDTQGTITLNTGLPTR
ncbi:PepSY domain-containing protein [Neoroseomonas lacus]|uniref:PepSY domain-containing protein n=1 Tax=Neoroseomonas lacus TaxID=287609 RepID=A0A917KSW8_9PROT|nr:PepSY domain-containing protein [Neoroseomonas lacus]GGJ23057.1 hypothetical protein GCM10011320_32900 [Neoroseomonas lacus]